MCFASAPRGYIVCSWDPLTHLFSYEFPGEFEWSSHSVSLRACVHVLSHSATSNSPWTVAHHGIFPARILDRLSLPPLASVSFIAGGFFTT